VSDTAGRRHWQAIWVTVAIFVLSAAIAIWAEYRADGDEGATPNGGTSPTTAESSRPGSPPPTTVRTTAPPAAFAYLSTLPPSSRTHLTAVPDDLPGPSTYARAIAIRCPGGGRTADVSFDLFGGYTGLNATVRPVFTVPTDRAIVRAFAVTKNPDDTVNKRPAGQVAVEADSTAPLAGALKDAQQLIIQVECPSADGVVVVDDGRLTRAA
jgi:hypothetical protein